MATDSFNLANTFGALQIGIAVATFLFCGVAVQPYTYYRRFKMVGSTSRRAYVPPLFILDHSQSSINPEHRWYSIAIASFPAAGARPIRIPPLCLPLLHSLLVHIPVTMLLACVGSTSRTP